MRASVPLTILMMMAAFASEAEGAFPVLRGDYLGQPLPGDEPAIFAPGILSTGLYTRDLAMTPEGDEIYFSVVQGGFSRSCIVVTRRVAGVWTEPEVAPFSGEPGVMDIEPAISPDGSRFMFMSTRGDSAAGIDPGGQDIWTMDRMGRGWSKPVNLGPPVNSEMAEYFPSITRDGTLYFTREAGDPAIDGIWRSRLVDGRYQEPERLPELVNTGRARYNAAVAPDESFLIVPIFGLEDSFGGTDYYVFFRDGEDRWSGPFHLDERVNSAERAEYSASLSPDGRQLFFMSGRQADAPRLLSWRELLERHNEPGHGNPAVWWVSASCIDDLRP